MLLSAIPVVDYYAEQKRKRIVLEGEVPSPINSPKGCPFNPRCPFATQQCMHEMPPLKDVGGQHYVACHNLTTVNANKKTI
jgi:oligopeptide/dipeptide ABC transporter ATP-binding protein